MTTARAPKTTFRLLLAAVVAVAALAAVGAPTAGAATSASQEATGKCWLAVINDWLDNGRIDHLYAIPCYTQAIQQLSLYPDVAGYSSAADDIHRALLAAIHQERGDGLGGGGPSGGGGTPPGAGGGNGGGPSAGSGSIVKRIGRWLGPGDAQSIPLPLLVLGGLALLLLLAAFGTWLARRLQTRRMTPAATPARLTPKRR
jgi:hypothetical protein